MLTVLALLSSLATSPAPTAAEPPPPRQLVARRVTKPPTLDGRLDDACWRRAAWSEPFVDIEGAHRPPPRYRTRAKLAWDDAHLYVAVEMEEPDVWATYTTRDQVVFEENDIEIFLDPDGDGRAYYELEVNCLGTIFDLYLHRTYRDGGPAVHPWDCAGLRTAIGVRGTVNDPRDEDRGWTLEWAIPFACLVPPAGDFEPEGAEVARAGAPPRPGDTWRVNFSRVQWRHVFEELDAAGRRVGPKRPRAATDRAEAAGAPPAYAKRPGIREDNWAWSPQGVVNMHVPERWGVVTFRAD